MGAARGARPVRRRPSRPQVYRDLLVIRPLTAPVTGPPTSSGRRRLLEAGLAPRASAVEYIAPAPARGTLTTKTLLCRAARSHGLASILRFFMVDGSSAFWPNDVSEPSVYLYESNGVRRGGDPGIRRPPVGGASTARSWMGSP